MPMDVFNPWVLGFLSYSVALSYKTASPSVNVAVPDFLVGLRKTDQHGYKAYTDGSYVHVYPACPTNETRRNGEKA